MENKKRREFLKASGIVLGGLIISSPLAALARGNTTSTTTSGTGTKKGTGTNPSSSSGPMQSGTGHDVTGVDSGNSVTETSRGYWTGYYQDGYNYSGYFQGMYY